VPVARSGVTVTNWAETYSATPRRYYEPESVEAVQAIVAAAAAERRVVKVVGSGHSPNDCVMTDDTVVSLRHLCRVLVVDLEARLVKVQAGITLADLSEALDRVGLALPNLGSISEQAFAGAIATGTHGSGLDYGALATTVVELQIVAGDGSLHTASRTSHPDLWAAARCSFGALGIVTAVVLQVVPAFDLEAVETPSTLPTVLAALPGRWRSAPYYRFWWFPHTDAVVEWHATPRPPHTARPRRPRTCTPRWAAAHAGALLRAVVGVHLYQVALWFALFVPRLIPWINALWFTALFSYTRRQVDRSDRVFNFDCLFRQHVDEWAIPLESLPQAMAALKVMLDTSGHKAHFPVEVRPVPADDTWLAPSAGRASVYIGIIMYKPFGVECDYLAYFRQFEDLMLTFAGRPHWAKDFHLRGDADFEPLYPHWHDFKRMRDAMDPAGVFANDFVRRTLGLPPAAPSDAPAAAAAHTSAAAAAASAAAAPVKPAGPPPARRTYAAAAAGTASTGTSGTHAPAPTIGAATLVHH